MGISFVIDGVSNSGGTDRVLSILSNMFSSRGHKITVHSLSNGEPYYSLDENVILKNYGSLSRILAIKKIINDERKTNNKIIVISMGKLSVQYILLSKLLLANNEVICSDHVGINSFSVHLKILKLACYSLYDKIVTLTGSDKDYIAKKIFINKDKVVSIKNMSPFPIIEKSSLQLSTKENLAIAVGRLSYQKNFTRLLEIWKNSLTENWRLLIIGDGDERSALESYISKNGMTNVDIIPSTKNIQNYYRKASCLLMTSRYEGLPMVLIEAKSFGLPVIAFNCPSGPSELIDGDGYLISYDSDESYIQYLNLLISDSEVKGALAFKALENAERFSENKIYSSWCEILNDEKK
ncbi:glycosyltransferase [Tatumella sp. UBA2305]|uniref:glycosyltransferase n=1 Tax=Tatumella sp. UBA2305 TaxID=1947647 RepID=UPI0025E286C4|nr:glycosyltransferase [Tatumella sp. UBA2305]